jgi:hypothetical protein
MDVVALYAAVVSSIALVWQIAVTLHGRRTRTLVRWHIQGRDLVVTVVNRGELPEFIRSLAFEPRLSRTHRAFARDHSLSLPILGVFRDPARGAVQRWLGESVEVDEGIVREFDPPLQLAPRADWVWTIPLRDLERHDLERGCWARVRLASGTQARWPRDPFSVRFYPWLLRNAVASLVHLEREEGAETTPVRT